MQLSAEIIGGRRTVLQNMLLPVQRVASEAGLTESVLHQLKSSKEEAVFFAARVIMDTPDQCVSGLQWLLRTPLRQFH